MLTNTSSAGPMVVFDESSVRDLSVLRAEARRLRDFFLEKAILAEETSVGPINRVTTLTFDNQGLSAIASLLHQLSLVGGNVQRD